MKVSNGYFVHPVSGEIIRPGEMFAEFDMCNMTSASPMDAVLTESVFAGAGGDGGEEEIKNEKEECARDGGSVIDKPIAGMTVSELRAMAEQSGIEGFSNMRKSELAAALEALGN